MRQLPGTLRDETVRRAIETTVAPAFEPVCAEAIERGYGLYYQQTGRRSVEPWKERIESQTSTCWQTIMRYLAESRRALPPVNQLREDIEALIAAVGTGKLRERVFLFETADALIGHYPAASIRCMTPGTESFHEWSAGYTDPRDGSSAQFVGPDGFLARVFFPFGIIPRTQPLDPPRPEGQFLTPPPAGHFTVMPDISAALARRLAADADHHEVLFFLMEVRERINMIFGEEGTNTGNLRVGRPLAGTPTWRLFDGLLTGLWPREAVSLPARRVRTQFIQTVKDLLHAAATIDALPRAAEALDELAVSRQIFDDVIDARTAAIWSDKVAAAAEGRDPALALFAQLWRGEALTRLHESASSFGNTKFAAHRIAWPIMPSTPLTSLKPPAKNRTRRQQNKELEGDALCEAARVEMKRFMPKLRAAICHKFKFADFPEAEFSEKFYILPVKLGML